MLLTLAEDHFQEGLPVIYIFDDSTFWLSCGHLYIFLSCTSIDPRLKGNGPPRSKSLKLQRKTNKQKSNLRVSHSQGAPDSQTLQIKNAYIDLAETGLVLLTSFVTEHGTKITFQV